MARPVSIELMPGCRGWLPVAELRRVARHVLDAEAVASQVGVEVVLADSATVQDVNRLYRGRDEPTDVLSFAQMDSYEQSPEVKMPAFVEAPEETPALGEIVVCVPYILDVVGIPPDLKPSQLNDSQRRAFAGQVSHLLVHGLLHILGYDHEESEEDSRAMQAREDQLLATLGYAGAYQHGQH
jgi:probable rRNA maturation factor